MKFSVVSKLVIECGEKLQCLRNPDFVRFSQKIPRNPDDTKKPRSSGKPPKKTFWGPMLNKCQIEDSISHEVIELES